MENPYHQHSTCRNAKPGQAGKNREQFRAEHWDKGRADRLAGLPCRSANGAYLEGWYSV